MVHGTDADLAAVVLRLMRTERVEDVAVGFVPAAVARSPEEVRVPFSRE